MVSYKNYPTVFLGRSRDVRDNRKPNKVMSVPRDLHLVVWGATGFTGSLATAYLAGDQSKFFSFELGSAPAGQGLQWAIAGRNHEKLAALKASTGAMDVEIIIGEPLLLHLYTRL